MEKESFKLPGFSLYKLKVGLASATLLFAFSQASHVFADQVGTPPSSSIAKTEAVRSPIEAAGTEIAADTTKPVVEESTAKPGDLIDVSKNVSPVDVKESQEGNQTVRVETSTVDVTKTEVAPAKVDKAPEPITRRTENTLSGTDENGNTYTQYERVDKTTTITYTSTPPTVTKAGSADIVFVVDRSGSMGGTIDIVRANINEFVRNITKEGITARFGLATFSDEVYGRNSGSKDEDTVLTRFGSSYFTTDPAELEKALAAIRIASGGDTPETPTPALNQIISTYDWSKSSKNKKFVVLLTDAEMKEDPSIPTVADTLAALKAAGIERTVATVKSIERIYKNFATEGRVLDIENNLADALTKGTTSWIVESVNEARYYKIIKDSYQFYLERRTTMPISTVYHVQAPTLLAKSEQTLPKTGSSEKAVYSVVGLGLLLTGLGLGISVRKSEEQ